MTNKKIAEIILNLMDLDAIVYEIQFDELGAKILDECNWDLDSLIYWAQENA